MKRILKFLLMPIFVFGPAMTVVACAGSSTVVSNEDILNSAVGQVRNNTFNMNQDLGLNSIPNDNSTWTQLNINARRRIQNYYQDLVSEEGNNWDYPTVAVNISPNEGARFVNKYHSPLVNVRINLLARLQYKGLEANKVITIWIDNDGDSATPQAKITAVGAYLTNDYLNDPDFIFPFQTLSEDGLTVEKSRSYIKIEQEVRSALFSRTTGSDSFAIIDLPGVEMSLVDRDNPNPSDVVFALNSSALDGDNNINGTINNLKIGLHFKNQTNWIELNTLNSGQGLKFVQEKVSASNQIGRILDQPNDGLQFSRNPLPTASQTFEQYDQAQNGTLSAEVKEKVFDLIAIYYPSTKMGSGWDQDAVSIGNQNRLFTFDDQDNRYGYFVLSFSFEVENLVNVTKSNIRLNLRLA